MTCFFGIFNEMMMFYKKKKKITLVRNSIYEKEKK